MRRRQGFIGGRLALALRPVANAASCCGSRRRWARARASSSGPRCGTARRRGRDHAPAGPAARGGLRLRGVQLGARVGDRYRRAADRTRKMSMTEIVIVAAARTPIGAFLGGLGTVPADQLGATVIKEVLGRAKVDAAEVSDVILGQVLTAGQGQNPARQAAIKASLPKETPAI